MEYSEKTLKLIGAYLDIEDQLKDNEVEHQAVISKHRTWMALLALPQEDQDAIEVLKLKRKQLQNRLDPQKKLLLDSVLRDARLAREAQQK